MKKNTAEKEEKEEERKIREKREFFDDKRSYSINHSEKAYKKGDFKAVSIFFEIAADSYAELGEIDMAQALRNQSSYFKTKSKQ